MNCVKSLMQPVLFFNEILPEPATILKSFKILRLPIQILSSLYFIHKNKIFCLSHSKASLA